MDAGTPDASPARRVFLVAGWRRWLMPAVFGTMAAGGLSLMLIDEPGTRGAGAVVTTLMLLAVAFGEWLIRFTRLVVSAEGIELRQLGYRLQATWSNVADFYGPSGRQGFILHQPLTGKGPDKLAFASNLHVRGVPMYDDVQRSLLAQRRFIPIEAFSAHLTRGALIDVVRRHAPAVAEAMRDTGRWKPAPPPDDPQSRRRTGLTIALIAAGVLAGIWISITTPPWIDLVFSVMLGAAMVLATIASAVSTLNAWRQRQSWWCLLFIAQTVVCALIALTAIQRLIATVA
ncbi:MAG TPA: hypothetical protein PKA20_27335 [Burkholderiaceae bacterium]|nr:hypothetical protein [Burkholderiaceae bacterium]